MNTIEEFLKNRISFTMERYRRFERDDIQTWGCMHNPLSLNITNTFDFVENLTPLFTYLLSFLEKYYSGRGFNISVDIYDEVNILPFNAGKVFNVSFGFDDFLSVNEVKTEIKKIYY